MQKNKKGLEMPINILVMIALAVFVIFLILGFSTGGWGRFTGIFGAATKGQSGLDAAVLNCKNFVSQYQSEGSPKISGGTYWSIKLRGTQTYKDETGNSINYECCKNPLLTNPNPLLTDTECALTT